MTELVFVGDPGVPATAAEGTEPVALRQIGGANQSWYGEAMLVLGPEASADVPAAQLR